MQTHVAHRFLTQTFAIPRRLIGGAVALIALLTAQAGAAMDIQEIKTPKGLTVWFLEDSSAPLISVAFALKGGTVYDLEGKEGLANFLAGMLSEGAGDLDSQAFSAATNDIGMRMSFDAGRDYFSGRFSALTEFQERSAELFNMALTQPLFDEAAMERNLQQIQTRLQIDAKDPQWIALRTMRKVLYPDHVYARRMRGTDQTLAAITADDMRAFMASRFALDNITIGVSGDIGADEVGAYVDSLFNGISEKATNQVFDKTDLDNSGAVVVKDWPTPQSFILASQEGIGRNDPDYLIAYVVNHILGGSNLTTRLNQEIREKRGWTYGISSFFTLADLAPLVQIAYSTQNEHAGESIDVVKEVWASLADGIEGEDLQAAKDYIIGNYALQRQSIRSTARYLQGLQIAGLQRDYPVTRKAVIEAITAEDIKRVAKRLFNPDTLRIVAVGQPENLEASLELPLEPLSELCC